jgi:hypothetical protein
MPHEFSATIYKQGINPCVDVPTEVSAALGGRGYISVRGTLDGHPIRATLVPLGKGKYCLFVNGAMRKAAGVDVGDVILVALELDPESRELPMPEAFIRALEQNPKAKAAFERLRPSRQKECLAYLNWLKRPESLERNVQKLINHLLAEEK